MSHKQLLAFSLFLSSVVLMLVFATQNSGDSDHAPIRLVMHGSSSAPSGDNSTNDTQATETLTPTLSLPTRWNKAKIYARFLNKTKTHRMPHASNWLIAPGAPVCRILQAPVAIPCANKCNHWRITHHKKSHISN
jgi:hypothetical protein